MYPRAVILLLFFSLACNHQQSSEKEEVEQISLMGIVEENPASNSNNTSTDTISIPPAINRDNIKKRLATKLASKTPLVVHVLIPLCDNEHQGIVPVSTSLGDGFNPRTNLYWGALYGFKTYFKNQSAWQLIKSIEQPVDAILERVVFKRTYADGQSIILVGDAYRGDKMKTCVEDYLQALAGAKLGSISIGEEESINIYGQADLLIFNGHNGLMDVSVDPVLNQDQIEKDAIVIACVSSSYFNDYLQYAKAYPLLMTTNLLAPEAYVIASAIEAWAKEEDGDSILTAAAGAYHKYQKCGVRGARNLFKTSW